MIDIGKILKRAWQILWSYRVLWIFGALLALTTGGGGSRGPEWRFGSQDWGNGRPIQGFEDFNFWFQNNIVPLFTDPELHVGTWIWIGIGLLLFFLIVGAIFAIVRYVSETAVLRMVDEHEASGQKVKFSQGWQMGWSRRAFRMWVIDLIIGIPAFLFVGILIFVGVLIFFSVRGGNDFGTAAGIVTAVGCLFLFIFVLVIGMTFLGLLRQFFIRKAALEDASIGQSLRLGWQMFRQNWKSALLTWLVMLGVKIGTGIAGFLAFFLLIPAYIILAIPGALVAGLPALIAFGISSLFTSGPLAWIIAIIVAAPLFFTVVFAPLILIGGWVKIFDSSVWTLAYREMKALEVVQPEIVTDIPE